MSRVLLHADLDAFYASVEQLDNPALRGRPVVVGGPAESRGVVATASYEARVFGVRSAQPMKTALARCPDAIRISPRFDRYHEVSDQVFVIFRRWTGLVEPLSLDEAFLDISARVAAVTPAVMEQAAADLKREVHQSTGLTLSVGAATNKSVAKIASDLRKPDGLVVVPPGAERVFLAPLPVARLWGVGPRAEETLLRMGVRTIGDLAALDRAWLERRFGRWGAQLHELAHGRDGRAVTPDRETKSVSAETTFAEDVTEPAALAETLAELTGHVARRLARQALRGRTISIKLRDGSFETHTRQCTLPTATDDESEILAAAHRLLEPELTPGRRLRLLGVGVSGFTGGMQLALPMEPAPVPTAPEVVAEAPAH